MASTEEALKVGVTVDDKTKKGLDNAKKNITAFEKSIKNLGKSLGVVFSVDAALRFGRTAANAFLEDEAAATKLNVAVKNLGYSFAEGYVTDYISNLEKTASVADDELRPAFQALLQQTGSLTQAQSLLNTAIQTSRGSGESLATTANDIAQAYIGNTKGLKKYYLGIDQATLKTMSFEKVQAALNTQFSGANEAYLNTYAGQVNALGIAWQNFQEKAGGSLLMLASLGQGDNASGLKTFATILNAIAWSFDKMAKGATSVMALLNVFGKNKGILGLFNPAPGSSPLGVLGKDSGTTSYDDFLKKYKKMLADIAAQNKKQLQAQLAAQKKLTEEQKKQALLKKQGTLFDIDQIELVAALKGKLSEEDKKRVELQLALLQGNEEEAARLSKEIANSIDKTGALARYLQTLPDANNPFKSWQDYLDGILATVKQITGGAIGGLGAGVGNSQVMPQTNAVDYSGFKYDPSNVGQSGSGAQFGAGTPWAQAAASSIYVQIDGKTIATAMQDQSLSGNNTRINRGGGGFQFL